MRCACYYPNSTPRSTSYRSEESRTIQPQLLSTSPHRRLTVLNVTASGDISNPSLAIYFGRQIPSAPIAFAIRNYFRISLVVLTLACAFIYYNKCGIAQR